MLAWAGPDTASRGCATRFGGAGPTPFLDLIASAPVPHRLHSPSSQLPLLGN